MDTRQAIQKAKNGECVKINSGCFLVSGDYLITEQKTWDEDGYKNTVFCPEALYVWTDDGQIETVDKQEIQDIITR